ncbi:hypothetical protein CAPTEDRAFT_215845 [Capitella teleta]|uniref:Uncharacterized protein n=1 Tax=Capitella teleta TaxID=283909 RepID=R7V4W5_CAPTE|nr:hypothetical protein CAPTEDRAFT_215845 [Capitella teleta]|eukprot:ELU13502.1 hypothetical protein CAPTEDRAFT_215845 [Capitella teleta]
MEKMERILEEFYTARQGARGSVAEWACRIEELVAQLERRDALSAGAAHELEVSSVGSNQVVVESMLNDKLDKVLEEMSSIRKRVERLKVGKLRRVAGSGQAASRKNGKRSQLIGEANEVIVNVEGVEVQALLDTGSMEIVVAKQQPEKRGGLNYIRKLYEKEMAALWPEKHYGER